MSTRAIYLFSALLTSLLVVACSQESKQPAEINSAESSAVKADAVAATDRTIVSGKLAGIVQENGSLAWQGIPYAEPPVGELRWKLPKPIAPWDGVFSADKPIQPCPQFVSSLSAGIPDPDGDGIVGDEDCLYLSVYAPSSATSSSKLPVMYWIFGGGNNSGYAGDYDGGFLAETQNVIVVAVNYRLGSLGWFLHPAIVEPGATGAAASGNWSDVDTQLGLLWVKDNIHAFGGDANNVTIFGESAGGANVMSLVTSPIAKGLFHRAIVESGGVGTSSLASAINFVDDEERGHPNSSKEIINKILIRDGKAKDRSEAKALQLSLSDDEIKTLLYQQNAATFLQLFNPEKSRNYPASKKMRDGTVFVEEDPLVQLASGNYNQVPMIIGTNRDERRIYMYSDPKWAGLIKSDPEEYKRIAKYQTDAWKLRGVDDLARIMSKVQGDSVYIYRYDWDNQATYKGVDLSVAIGAAHATEMAFVFGDWSVGFVPKEILYTAESLPEREKLSAAMMSYWANFAYNGDPDKGRDGHLADWTAWQSEEGKDKMIIFDAEPDGGIRMSDSYVTGESIKAEFLSETFSDVKNRCYTYATTFVGTDQYSAEEYKSLGCTAPASAMSF